MALSGIVPRKGYGKLAPNGGLGSFGTPFLVNRGGPNASSAAGLCRRRSSIGLQTTARKDRRRYLFRGVEALFDFRPVDHIPPSRNIVGPAVLIVQVVGVLPPVQAHHRELAFHHRAILVGGGKDIQLAVGFHQPSPAGAEARGRCLGKLLLESVEAAEIGRASCRERV